MTAGVGLGPRVMMTRRAMDETELLQPGSRATERYLFALGDKLKVADVRAQIEKILPDAQVTDFRETSPTLTQGVDRATGLLSLICLVAMCWARLAWRWRCGRICSSGSRFWRS